MSTKGRNWRWSQFEDKYIPEPNSGCWIWIGGVRGSDGYGLMYVTISMGDGVPGFEASELAHRYAYKRLVGPITDRLTVDHVCTMKRCVNPTHLRLLSRREHGRIDSNRRWKIEKGR